MAEALRDRRFVTYLIVTNVALVALAIAGAVWFVSGLVGFAVVETVSTLRSSNQPQPTLARVNHR